MTGYNTIAQRVGAILSSKSLTMYQATLRSEALFGKLSRYFLPHNFYHALRDERFSPSIFQLAALSRITNYRLDDWLRVFGCDLQSVPGLQVTLPHDRTILLDSDWEDPVASIPWFRSAAVSPDALVPLSRALSRTEPRRLRGLSANSQRFLYAKVGKEDAFAFPELLPGSIVRVDRRYGSGDLPTAEENVSKRAFLVQHRNGFFCSRLRYLAPGSISPFRLQAPDLRLQFQVGEQANIVGMIDLEIRNLVGIKEPRVAEEFRRLRHPQPLSSPPEKLSSLLQQARQGLGLSLRAASLMSRRVATSLADDRYFVSPGALSDYEAADPPPRHFQKLVSFSAIYALPFRKVLSCSGLSLDECGTESIPDSLVPRPLPSRPPRALLNPERLGDALEQILDRLIEVPFFLRGCFGSFTGLKRPGLRDLFWVGDMTQMEHPHLNGAVLVIVNRQRKRLAECSTVPAWRQSLFVILRRDGSYTCGCCERDNRDLVLHTQITGTHKTERLRSHDAEVVGQVVAVVRRTI